MADFFVGVPLVATLGTLRLLLFGRRPIPAEIQRIALFQLAAIGDTILMSSVWRDLRQSFPSAQITVFVGESNYEIACVLFGDENVRLLPVKKPWLSLCICRRHPVDVLLDFGPWPRWNVLLALAMPSRWRAGYKTKGQYRHFAYDALVPHSGEVHEMENHRALAAHLNVATTHLPHIPEKAFDLAEDPAGHTRRVILHAWSGGFQGFYKQWPLEYWVELARRLSSAGFEVELSGAPSDRAKSRVLMDAMRLAGVVTTDRTGDFSIAECIKRIRNASAVISVDTGMMHLAAVAGVLTIGMHGPSPSRRWGAIGPRSYSIESPCPGCGFLDLGFEYPREVPPCMQAISVDRVWDEIVLRFKECGEPLGEYEKLKPLM